MSNNQPMQCNFCFYSFGPFYEVRILPITAIASLSGTATPPHASIPGTKQIVCHHCRYSHYNIEPWTEPDDAPSLTLEEPTYQPSAEEPPDTSACLTLIACNDLQPVHNRQDYHAVPPVSPLSTTRLPFRQWQNERSRESPGASSASSVSLSVPYLYDLKTIADFPTTPKLVHSLDIWEPPLVYSRGDGSASPGNPHRPGNALASPGNPILAGNPSTHLCTQAMVLPYPAPSSHNFPNAPSSVHSLLL